MDYQEAIHCMKVMTEEEVCEECNYYQSCDDTKQADMARIAISAMQELQLYKDNKLCLIPENVYRKQCDELDGYKQTGTLEEVRDAVERQKAKKATDIRGDKLKFCTCPSCGKRISNVEGGNYCQNCGQKLDWSDENEKIN